MSSREARAFACTLAQEAVQLREGAGQAHAVHHKAPGDWASELDLRSEDHLRQRIAKTLPNHAFLGEDSNANGTNKDFVWVVDPIDGSMNFLRGYPQYSVSIALWSAMSLLPLGNHHFAGRRLMDGLGPRDALGIRGAIPPVTKSAHSGCASFD